MNSHKQNAGWPVAALPKFAIAAAIVLCIAPAAMAQDDTTATQAAVEATTAAAAQQADTAADVDTTHSIMLLGEKVGLNENSPNKKPYPELLTAAAEVLGSDISEFTIPGATLRSTAEAITSADQSNADVVIIFGGHSDEEQKASDEEMRQAIIDMAEGLRKRNPEMQVFLVPSATFVGTLTSARMRLAAEEADITFVPLGTEVSGEPFAQTLRAIRAELNQEPEPEPAPAPTTQATAPSPEPTPTPTPAPSQATTARGTDSSQPDTAVRPGTPDYDARQSALQRELNRIAGDTQDSSILPADVTSLSTASLSAEPTTATGTIPAGGTLTKRGSEATETINMRSLPALKAFRPQIPVPRNQVDKKEPALSR